MPKYSNKRLDFLLYLCYNAQHEHNEKRNTDGVIDNDSRLACLWQLLCYWHVRDYGQLYTGGIFYAGNFRLHLRFIRAKRMSQLGNKLSQKGMQLFFKLV